MGKPEVRLHFNGRPQDLQGFIVSAGEREYLPFQRIRHEANGIQFSGTRYLRERLVVTARVRKKVCVTEMRRCTIWIEFQCAEKVFLTRGPVPVVPKSYHRQRAVCFGERL